MAGRKPYKPKDIDKEIVYKMRVENCKMEEVIDKLGICKDTFYKNYEFFADTLKSAEITRDLDKYQKVKDKLFDRAIGETVQEKVYVVDENGKLNIREIKEKTVCSDTAMIFYLVNKSNGEFVSINKENSGKQDNKEAIDTIKKLLDNDGKK